jgi:hypothetical protein
MTKRVLILLAVLQISTLAALAYNFANGQRLYRELKTVLPIVGCTAPKVA